MYEIKLHYYQKAILKKLVYKPKCRFNELIIEGLESEHMNYHLKKLVDFGLATNVDGEYQLTDQGKDYSNLLDDNIDIPEKQPKTSVLIRAVRTNPDTGEIENLVNRRLRHPYYGKVGGTTGKVRFGETVFDAARREILEETGLHPKTLKLISIYHKIRRRDESTVIQDVIFYVFFATDFDGALIEKTEFQENFWASEKELIGNKDVDLYDDYIFYSEQNPEEIEIVESIDVAEGF